MLAAYFGARRLHFQQITLASIMFRKRLHYLLIAEARNFSFAGR
jgi:hypothetical protein